MNTTFFYGVILAVSNIVLTLVGFFLGFQTDKIAEGRWFGWLSLVVGIAVTWLGVRAVREESAGKSLSYGKGVGAGFLINVYSGLIGSIYAFIHFTFINPSYADYTIDLARQKAGNASDAQLAVMEKWMRFMLSPAMISVIGMIMALIFGILIALVVSAFLKRAPKGPVEEASAVV
jgi:Protein of unknown function (DUF4199)